MTERPRLEIAAIWAVSAWPAINFSAANFSEIRYGGAASLSGVVAFVFVLGAAGNALRQWGAASLRGAVLASWVVLVGMLFGYSALRSHLSWLLAIADLPLTPGVCWLALLCSLLGAAWRWRNQYRLRMSMAVFSFAAVLMALGSLTWVVASSHTPNEASAEPRDHDVGGVKAVSTPNVYYFILDAYLGRSELRRITGFDNREFIAGLVDLGFVDASGASSNYIKTSQTLGALFQMDYPQTDSPATWIEPRLLYPDLFERDRAPPLVKSLEDSGLVVWHAASIWSGCPARHLRCLGDATGHSPGYVTQSFLAPTPFGRPLMHFLGRKMDALATVRGHMGELIGARRPFFLFAHHLAPHPPYFRNADCSPRTDMKEGWNGWEPESRSDYLAALQCVNREVMPLVTDILSADPDAIIVLQGDHGTAFGLDWDRPIVTWPFDWVRQRTSFINLVRLPGRCRQNLHIPLGQINTIRSVIACLDGKPAEYLPEVTFLSTYSGGVERRVVRRLAKGLSPVGDGQGLDPVK